MKKLLFRIVFALNVCLLLLIIWWLTSLSRASTVTLGTLAQKQTDMSGCRVIIVNAISGTRNSQFIVFDAGDRTRNAVVLAFAAGAEVETDATSFRGYCVGLIEHRIEPCPCDPPFVYIIDVRPIHPAP